MRRHFYARVILLSALSGVIGLAQGAAQSTQFGSLGDLARKLRSSPPGFCTTLFDGYRSCRRAIKLSLVELSFPF